MFRAIVYYAIYALVIIALATAIILAFRPKANAPGTTGKGTIGTISETTGELTFGNASGSIQSNTVNPNQSSTSSTATTQPASASGTRNSSSGSTTITSPTTTTTPTNSTTSGQLTDTGPGEVVVLAIATSITGYFIAVLYQKKKLQRA